MARLKKVADNNFTGNIIVEFCGREVYTTNDIVDAYTYCEVIYGVTEEDWESDGTTFPNGDAEYKGINGNILKIIQEREE